jgi:hypothetical protein
MGEPSMLSSVLVDSRIHFVYAWRCAAGSNMPVHCPWMSEPAVACPPIQSPHKTFFCAFIATIRKSPMLSHGARPLGTSPQSDRLLRTGQGDTCTPPRGEDNAAGALSSWAGSGYTAMTPGNQRADSLPRELRVKRECKTSRSQTRPCGEGNVSRRETAWANPTVD